MPYLRYISFIKNYARRIRFSCVAIAAVSMCAVNAHAAGWSECEKAKLREIKLQRGETQKISKHKKRHQREEPHQSLEEIDTWLWKNCREFSYELRQLEQDKM